jgi:hypothetical protein
MLPVSITEGGVLPREIKAIPFRKHDLDNTVGDATKCDLIVSMCLEENHDYFGTVV